MESHNGWGMNQSSASLRRISKAMTTKGAIKAIGCILTGIFFGIGIGAIGRLIHINLTVVIIGIIIFFITQAIDIILSCRANAVWFEAEADVVDNIAYFCGRVEIKEDVNSTRATEAARQNTPAGEVKKTEMPTSGQSSFMPKKKTNDPVFPIVLSDGSFKCPACGQVHQNKRNCCWNCGQPFLSEDEDGYIDLACPQCGETISFRTDDESDNRFCPHCGTRLMF